MGESDSRCTYRQIVMDEIQKTLNALRAAAIIDPIGAAQQV
jgi:hypothetical protein